MGLDHPLVQDELLRWRSMPPEELGIVVAADIDGPVLLSFWLVETSSTGGERRVFIHPIAVRQDGTRVPSIERQSIRYFHAPSAVARFTSDDRLNIFSKIIEPALQRDLKLKSTTNIIGSFAVELIGYIEIVGEHLSQ